MASSSQRAYAASSGRYTPLIKLLLLLIAHLPFIHATPLGLRAFGAHTFEEQPLPPESATLWIYLAVAAALVLIGGAFAGLTIALMGQDEIYLQVIKTSGDSSERKNAAKVLRLLERGKHWVLVTLLLGNVIVNETLPIVLDRSLGGGWPAVLGSTVLIVIFGEVIPQSVCVRYGLPIGAWMSPFVLVLMYLLAPAAWPTAKLLDYLLGEDHGTTYKKAGLKTLVTLHKSLGEAGEQLNQDEVTIISAVLDLKAKPVGSIMTPMADVFTMSSDTVLDEKTMEVILGAGYSRIPIHAPDNKENFVGMLLVKILITYDPEDARRVSDFALATLPETRSETSCLDIVNFFQEGKSHMVLVSEFPGDNYGALGVVTLEDVIEELIGEEIIDESDVFVDVHKAIRRMTPAPKSRVPKGAIVENSDDIAVSEREPLLKDDKEQGDPRRGMRRTPTADVQALRGNRSSEVALSPNRNNALRRTSSAQVGSDREGMQKKPMPSGIEHLKHLGPSNPASRPKTTRYNTVKVKPGPTPTADGHRPSGDGSEARKTSISSQPGPETGLLRAAGKDAKDGVLALHAGYGSIPSGSPPSPKNSRTGALYAHAEESARNEKSRSANRSRRSSESTVGSMSSGGMLSAKSIKKRPTARSGSITENVIDSGGIKKTVLELTSSSEEQDKTLNGQDGRSTADGPSNEGEGGNEAAKGGKKKRRRRKKKGGDENEPLLDH